MNDDKVKEIGEELDLAEEFIEIIKSEQTSQINDSEILEIDTNISFD